MNVLRRIIYSAIVFVLATAAAIEFMPGYSFVQHTTTLIGLGVLSCITLAAISFYREDDLTMHDKNLLMNAFLIAVLVPSFYTAGAFIHESQTSWSGGEIHWHADYEVFVQQRGELQRLDLIDPSNYCNGYMCSVNDRTGITKYHEHNDNRIHLEGVFREREDATLSAYFETFNGELSNTRLVYPTNNGVVSVKENANRSLKILVRKGVANQRHWCAIGGEVPVEDRCQSADNGEIASSPSEYVISPYKRGATLDDIFIVYDSKTTEEALADVRKDGKYRGMGLRKSGEGF
ncbi:MAG: hypothetical protein ABEJ98_02560 [Candidatus Nanohaloarchaea archaeon]